MEEIHGRTKSQQSEQRSCESVEDMRRWETITFHETQISSNRTAVQQSNKITEPSRSGSNGSNPTESGDLRISKNIETLQDSISYFALRPVLEKVEESLQDLRRSKKTSQEHELCLKEADKEMQRLSMRFHPDRVKSNGGSQNEILDAVELQTALNMTRSLINAISRVFLHKLHVYYRYDCFMDMRLCSLGNEDLFQKSMNDVLHKIELISSTFHETQILTNCTEVQLSNNVREPSRSESNGSNAAASGDLRISRNIETLQDSISYFALHPVLGKLEESLEDVRRSKISAQEHELCLKEADKKMQRLCMRFHPDRVKNNGGCQSEILAAAELQTALNMTRTVINVISRMFLDELHVYYKYDFFTDMRLCSLGNEDLLQKRMNDVLYKIGLLSSIIQEKIVARIHKFLKSSRASICCFINSDESDFKKQYHLAHFYLKQCIKGYKELLVELERIECENRNDGLIAMNRSLGKMFEKYSVDLEFLKALEANKYSLDGAFLVFQTDRCIDEYFVLPFVCYINVLLMCSILSKREKRVESWSDKIVSNVKMSFHKLIPSNTPQFSKQQNVEELQLLQAAYFLLSYLEDKAYFEREVKMFMQDVVINKRNLFLRSYILLLQIDSLLEERFKLDSYVVFSARETMLKKISKLKDAYRSDNLEAENKFEEHKIFSDVDGLNEDFPKIEKENEQMKKTLKSKLKILEELSESFQKKDF